MQTDFVGDFYRGWNERSADAIARTFARDGTFADPLCRTPLSNDALHAHIASFAAALPELEFAVQRTLRDGDGVAVAWSLNAVCRGSLDREIVANGVPFTLEGIDLFHIAEDGIASVRRVFERRDLAERLGLQSFVEPIEVGTMTFGYSLRDSATKAKPAVLGMTWILARDDNEKAKIRDFARRIIKSFREIPGYIGVVTGFAGLHGFTFTEWESEEALRAGVHGLEHVEAMREFHRGISAGVFTSVWQPLRLNRMWIHCTHCGAANDGHRADRRCQRCGTPWPEPPPYI